MATNQYWEAARKMIGCAVVRCYQAGCLFDKEKMAAEIKKLTTSKEFCSPSINVDLPVSLLESIVANSLEKFDKEFGKSVGRQGIHPLKINHELFLTALIYAELINQRLLLWQQEESVEPAVALKTGISEENPAPRVDDRE